MGVECRIYFNTSFRSTMIDDIPYFFNEGFCELYGAKYLKDAVKELNGTGVKFLVQNSSEYRFKDCYGNPLKVYSLDSILNILENHPKYKDWLESGAKSSLKVCVGILKAIKENSSQTSPIVMLDFK